MPANGIDVSRYQSNVNYQAVKASGRDFMMIRAGYGMYLNQKDPLFETHYQGGKAAGLSLGAYHYSYARNPAEAAREAEVFLDFISAKTFSYPVALDIEDKSQLGLSQNVLTDIARTFCERVQNAGYYVMIYSNKNFLLNHLNLSSLPFDIWLAHYASQTDYPGAYGIWQYTSSANVPGVNGRCNANYSYKDYPAIIQRAGLNGFDNDSSQPVPPSSGIYAQCNADSVNIRSGPSVRNARIGRLNYGNEILVLSGAGGWYSILAGNLYGYVAAEYITVGGIPGSYAQCNANDVNVRSGPGVNYPVLRRLNRGNQLIVTDRESDWYRVIVAGLGGYVTAQYITVGGI